MTKKNNLAQQNLWWRGAVIYQIYPRSFFDSNNDGIGDLNGIIEKLAYIASLNIDAIWISPFLTSPQKDFGYDVADYYSVDPLFGSLDDFDRLIDKAHALDIKVLMDQVLNHTSDQHPWFQESRQNKTNAKADWYVWVDAKPDGSVPNNWLSVFGGSAWQWDEMRQQYYLHNFLTSQPDLNFHHPEVVDTMLNIMRFWLERGVDGFRLDTVNFYIHDKALRDNPLRAAHELPAEGVPPENPYARQHHLYDKSQLENFVILKRIRQLMNEFPATTTIGELGDDNSLVTGADYVRGGDHLHMVYTFHLLDVGMNFSAKLLHDTIYEVEKHIVDGWPCWSLSNHDVVRIATRLACGIPSHARNLILMAFLFSIRGTICLYQGEELGLVEADVPYEKMQDPYGLAFYPTFKGRDGCRTPLPWQHDKSYAGFSKMEPWLPVDEKHLNIAIDIQEKDPHSTLNCYRQFLVWRKNFAALTAGAIHLFDVQNNEVLAFERYLPEQRILVLLNFSDQAINLYQLSSESLALTADDIFHHYRLLQGHGFQAQLSAEHIILPAYGALFAEKIA